MITNRIIKLLEEGVVPWHRPWNSAGVAVNWKTQKPYRGINTLLLPPGEYASKKVIEESGGKLIKNARWELIIFWNWMEKEDEETGELEKFPFMRFYKAYDINTQCEGLKSKRPSVIYSHNPIEKAEEIIQNYKNAPTLKFGQGRAFYRPSHDLVSVPPMEDYKVVEEYYCTLFHELIHSTGSASRLCREGITDAKKFGDDNYSKEELIAEIGAAMICGIAGIEQKTIGNSAAYINGWLRALKNDPKLITQAAGQAQKACDHILGVTFDEADAA